MVSKKKRAVLQPCLPARAANSSLTLVVVAETADARTGTAVDMPDCHSEGLADKFVLSRNLQDLAGNAQR